MKIYRGVLPLSDEIPIYLILDFHNHQKSNFIPKRISFKIEWALVWLNMFDFNLLDPMQKVILKLKVFKVINMQWRGAQEIDRKRRPIQ